MIDNKPKIGRVFALVRSHSGILAILFGALCIRLLLFDYVPVNYDSGLYLSDGLRAIQGEVPLVDYHSRSPFFHYLLGLGLTPGFSPLVSGRIMMFALSVAIGLVLYLLAGRLHSKRAGLVAAAIFVFTPLTIFWGTWIKTEQAAALLVLLGLLAFLPHIDTESIRPEYGVIFGSLAGFGFLIRRVVIVHAIILTLFIVWYRLRHYDDRRQTSLTGFAVLGSMTVTVFLSYLLLAGGNLHVTAQLIDYHLLQLLPTDIQLVRSSDEIRAVAALPSSILVFCNGCSDRTIVITLQTVAVSFPAFLGAWLYFRSVLFRVGDRSVSGRLQTTIGLLAITGFVLLVSVYTQFILGVFFGIFLLLGLSLLAVLGSSIPNRFDPDFEWRAVFDSDVEPSLAKAILGLTILFMWGGMYMFADTHPLHIIVESFPRPYLGVTSLLVIGYAFIVSTGFLPDVSEDIVQAPYTTALVVLVGVVWFGHLGRDQLLFVSYFQDIFPYLAVLIGVGISESLERMETTKRARTILVVLLVFAVSVSLLMAPYINARHGATERPYDPSSGGTVTNVQLIGDDISDRTEPGDQIFTAQPLYALESEATNFDQFSREFWLISRHPHHETVNSSVGEIKNALQSGEIQYVVWEFRTRELFDSRTDLGDAFNQNYCRVTVDESAYEVLDARLYEHTDRAPDC